MLPSSQAEIESIISTSRTIADSLSTGAINQTDFLKDPIGIVALHGIDIHPTNHAGFLASMNEIVPRHIAAVSARGGSEVGKGACDLALTIAFSALLILSVAAVVTVIIVFAPEVAGPVVLAFLECNAGVDIFLGVILTGSGVLAGIVCNELIS